MFLLRFVVVLSLSIFAFDASSQPDIQVNDPAIGSYFWFAALNKKCPETSASREEALERFKEHFIANIKAMVARNPEIKERASRMIENLERNGPAKADLEKFDSLLTKGTPNEIRELCESAAADMTDRMMIERKMIEATQYATPAIEHSKPR